MTECVFVLSFVVFVLSAVYTCLLFYFIFGSQRLYKKHPITSPDFFPSISVVVPIRNEEVTLLKTLEALKQQDYQGPWEVLCVNDRSTDQTPSLLKKFCDHHARFHYLEIPHDSPEVTSPKKRALKKGFDSSVGDILMTTDADCLPPSGWLTSMAKNFTDSIGIVQGPKRIIGPNTPINLYQKLETFGLASIEAATFAIGKPMLASAPSLAYRKSLYEKAGGFEGLEHLVSGDDDMLVHKMAKIHPGLVRYNLDAHSSVAVSPVSNWFELLTQRARWTSNGTKYQDKKYVALLFFIYLFYVWLVASVPLALVGAIPIPLAIGPFCLKFFLDTLFLVSSAQKLPCNTSLKHIAWAELIHIPLVLIAAPMGQFKMYKWKP